MDGQVKVAVVSICKNEEQFIRRWSESCADADYRILLDTGSSDNSVAVAKECGVIVHEQVFTPWHFAKARNHLLDLIPDDVDWIINLDVDELIGRGWRKALEAVPTDGSVNRPRYGYTWNWKRFEHNEDGSVNEWKTIKSGEPGVFYHGDKITGRFTHRWVNAVHEVNVTQPGYEERQLFVDGIKIYHFADQTKSRGSYLPLLLQDVEENPNNDRNTYYAARELFFYGRFEEATKLFKRHLTMPESVWPPERAWSMRYLAKMHPNEAEHWHLRACAEYPTGAEVWTDLAKHYYTKNNWRGMYFASKRALECSLYKGLYLTEPEAYGWWPNDMAALSAFNLGLHGEAIHHGRTAYELNKEDQRLKNNLFFYKNAVSSATVVIPTKSNFTGLDTIVKQLVNDNKVTKIVVVADGKETYEQLDFLPAIVTKVYVSRGAGIHRMWNIGLALAHPNSHVFFVNDDVSLAKDCVSQLVAALDADESIGLVSPHYANTPVQPDIESRTTCRGRYDGTGGMAGFAMMLTSDLVPYFKFNEEMKWWYGDDYLVDWVYKIAERRCVITARTSCMHYHSQTVNNDTPENFAAIVNNDKIIYEKLTNDLDNGLPLVAELQYLNLPTQTHRGVTDIVEHLNTLRNLANKCEHVTEFGTRFGISTSALICGQPDTVVSYDINKGFFEPYQSEVEALAQAAGVNFQFVEGDVLGVSIEETDLLFIDTYHTYNQLTKELNKHNSKVKKYIVLHDTVTYGTTDEKPYEYGVVSEDLKGLQRAREGLWVALEDFLAASPDWRIKEHYENNNGLTVLEKVN